MKNGYATYLLPSFDLIHNFPVPKFWTKEYKEVMKELSTISGEIVLTRTRFFLSSLLGGLWAKKHRKKWIHTEHGSDSVVLEKKWKTLLAYIYDSLFGGFIFSRADTVTAVSEGSRRFIESRWKYEKLITVIYRGIEVITGERKEKQDTVIHIGFVGRVVKLK
jgi:glycosyltransferase involved in cell wall biosynthesis